MIKIFKYTLGLFVINFIALTQSDEIDLNEIQSRLPLNLTIPPEYSNTTAIIEEAKRLLREKCIATSGSEESYNEIEEGSRDLIYCAMNLINVTALQDEIEAARPTGELDTVFKKYCQKRNTGLECVETFNNKLTPCMDEEERKQGDVFLKIATGILEFICHKEGDSIALFIAEKGPECLNSKKESLAACVNQTLAAYLPGDGKLELETLPKFVMGPKQCRDITVLRNCVVNSLSTCEEITPANLVESLFRFVGREADCKTLIHSELKATKAGSSDMKPFWSLISFLIVIKLLIR